MREVKFRAWDKKDNVFLFQENEGTEIKSIYQLFEQLRYDEVHGHDIVLMQFTGLRDKNGVEIYEGDVILTQKPKDNYPLKHIVVFNEEKSGFKLRWAGRYKEKNSFYDIDLSSAGYSVFETIGNIYQNSELLKD